MSKNISARNSISMIVNRDQGGGPKKQGLVPTACYGELTILRGQRQRPRSALWFYNLYELYPPSWRRYRANLPPRINGNYQMNG